MRVDCTKLIQHVGACDDNRDAEEGYNKCSLCGFENFKRFAFCNVCGDEIYDEEREKKKRASDVKKLWKSRKKGSIEILSRASAIPRSTTRQQRARYDAFACSRAFFCSVFIFEDVLDRDEPLICD
jgi:hypothetical protein